MNKLIKNVSKVIYQNSTSSFKTFGVISGILEHVKEKYGLVGLRLSVKLYNQKMT